MSADNLLDRRAVIKAAAVTAGLVAVGGATAWAVGSSDEAGGTAGSSAGDGRPAREGSARGGRGEHPNSGRGSRTADGKSQDTGTHGKASSNANHSGSDGEGVAEPPDSGHGDMHGQNGSREEDRNGQPNARDDQDGDGPGDGHTDGDGSGSGNGNGGGDGADPGVPALVQAADVPVGGGVVIPQHRLVITQPQPGTFRCFGSRCTHAGCLVDAVTDGTIHCPCHGSLFDMSTGDPVAGPAPAPLDNVPIKVKSGAIYRG